MPRGRRRGFGHRFASGGLSIDHHNPRRLFISRGVGRRYQVEVWTSDENFRHWKRRVVSPKGQSCFRPVGSTGPGPQMVFFVCGYHRFWTDYRTRIYGVRVEPVEE